ncbi:hypothetical protein Pint_09535 [Pistacia integerrima]|uniref:Uncharacterized protein n=1 Tax=Pistacia integerrima TaxID=434235 RepID=A0ACC0XDV5_9ROSI|nr:hypothetical protein Pint_09535 [Pistacia integerrima]
MGCSVFSIFLMWMTNLSHGIHSLGSVYKFHASVTYSYGFGYDHVYDCNVGDETTWRVGVLNDKLNSFKLTPEWAVQMRNSENGREKGSLNWIVFYGTCWHKPLSVAPLITPQGEEEGFRYGLGHDTVSNDYKAVGIVQFSFRSDCLVI